MGRHSRGLSPEISQVRPWHKAIVRNLVMGERPSTLAKRYGMTKSHISRILASPLVIAEIQRLEALAEYTAVDMRTELELRHGKTLEAIDKALASENESLAASTGFNILDRTGYGKQTETQKHAHVHLHTEVGDMDTKELQDEAMDLVGES